MCLAGTNTDVNVTFDNLYITYKIQVDFTASLTYPGENKLSKCHFFAFVSPQCSFF